MMPMRIASLTLATMMLASCALPKRRFIDVHGQPLPGVLVLSNFPGDMLFGGAMSTAFLTDKDGYAPVAWRRAVMAIKPGYHAWTVRGHDDRGRTTIEGERDAAVMYRRSERAQPHVDVARHHLQFVTVADEVQALPLPAEMKVTLELVDRRDFHVRASKPCLLKSGRFFFAGADHAAAVASLQQADDLFFYVRTSSKRVFKVGVTRSHNVTATKRMEVEGRTRHVPTEMVTVLWAELSGDCRIVEPQTMPVSTPWLRNSTELLHGDAAAVAAALDAAIQRGEVRDGEIAQLWLHRLRLSHATSNVVARKP